MADPDQGNATGYIPLYQTNRGKTVESIHFGAIAVVTAEGKLFALAGDPHTTTFLRSSAKPFQTLPLVEMGGLERYQMTGEELAVTCASHSGTDTHLKTIYKLQQKIGVSESDLLCCTHQPFDSASRVKLRDQGKAPSPNHHNCSGKHTGMLGQAKLLGVSLEKYTEVEHPVQEQIKATFCEMCEISQDLVSVGRDGCSVPTFAIPLFHAAWGWARLVNPAGLPEKRAEACKTITKAMAAHPF
ncbi:MAG: asparaginase, partial [Chloroflexi bacterium]|nr:asparaginase [Chloroflexota bacterium]